MYILISEITYSNYLFLGDSHPKTGSAGKIPFVGIASYNVCERSIK